MECGFQRSQVHIFLIFSVHLPYCPKHSDSTVEFIKGFHSLSKSRFISFYFFHYYGFIVTSLVIVGLNLSSFFTLWAIAFLSKYWQKTRVLLEESVGMDADKSYGFINNLLKCKCWGVGSRWLKKLTNLDFTELLSTVSMLRIALDCFVTSST